MNRQRELALQRVSRIGSIAAVESVPQTTKFKGKPVGTLSIEAALGTYMMKKNDVYNIRQQQDSYIHTQSEPKMEKFSRQMAEYMAAIEGSRIVNKGSNVEYNEEDEKLYIEKLNKALENDPSARYQLSHYMKKTQDASQADYDLLDANRSTSFLLYSYNKSGVHSVLGEHIAPGSYGGRITDGDFESKA